MLFKLGIVVPDSSLHLCVASILATLFCLFSLNASAAEQELKILFIDVGQGDSTLVILPNNSTILIDGGEPDQGQKLLARLKENGVGRIDAMVATHPHADHIGGLTTVLGNLDVRQVLDSGQIHTTQIFEDFIETIGENGVPLSSVYEGDSIRLDNRVTVEVLNPPPSLREGTYDEEKFNDNSVVIRLKYRDFSAIFGGDVQMETETRLASKDVDVDVLLAPHHGSAGSSNVEFLRAVSPEVVIISAGADNPYGHPHKEALDRIYGVTSHDVFRTDIDGTITILTTGDGRYTVETARSERAVEVPEYGLAIGAAAISFLLFIILGRGTAIWKLLERA